MTLYCRGHCSPREFGWMPSVILVSLTHKNIHIDSWSGVISTDGQLSRMYDIHPKIQKHPFVRKKKKETSNLTQIPSCTWRRCSPARTPATTVWNPSRGYCCSGRMWLPSPWLVLHSTSPGKPREGHSIVDLWY